MPLTRLKDEYLEQDGVRFLMEDQDGSTVACRVSHQALRDHADRLHFSGTDGAVFEAYRELIEQVASDAYDAEGPFDDNGRVLVTPEALARVTRSANGYTMLGVVVHDGTPLKSVEVRVDDGPWRPAVLDPVTKAKYSWKLFNYAWNDATPGEHTIVSRVTDVNGRVQPTLEELESKKTFLEDNSQYPRKVMIS